MEGATTMSKELIKRLYYYSTFDGCLHRRNKGCNASFIINMLKRNCDYVECIKRTLEELEIGCLLMERKDYNTDGYGRKPQIRLESRRHPKLTKIYERIYIDGHKVIDPHMLTLLDAEALAIIFMADGSRHTGVGVSSTKAYYRLNTKGFSYGDNWLLKKAIKEKLDLEFNIHRQNQYFYLALRAKDSELFESLVSPYMLPSFRYKLGRQTLLEIEDDEIVCPVSRDAELGRNDLILQHGE